MSKDTKLLPVLREPRVIEKTPLCHSNERKGCSRNTVGHPELQNRHTLSLMGMEGAIGTVGWRWNPKWKKKTCIRKEKAAQWEGQRVVPVMEAGPKSLGSQTSTFCCLQRKATFCALWLTACRAFYLCHVPPPIFTTCTTHTHTSPILPASYSMIQLFITQHSLHKQIQWCKTSVFNPIITREALPSSHCKAFTDLAEEPLE